ncbi:MAG: FAD-binding protein, partial [Deltaproteobacteria bacterium]|nr:FAD-binding protein [Deltaproteobacteria bacterium]
MKLIQEFRIPYEQDSDLKSQVAQSLDLKPTQIDSIRVLKRSLDARQRSKLTWVYSLEVYLTGEEPSRDFEPFPQVAWKGPPPLILGAGPAGLFAAWTFLAHGIKPIL